MPPPGGVRLRVAGLGVVEVPHLGAAEEERQERSDALDAGAPGRRLGQAALELGGGLLEPAVDGTLA